jgi:hypothetical protein
MHTMRLEAARLQAILEGELMSGSADVRRTARAGPNNCPPLQPGQAAAELYNLTATATTVPSGGEIAMTKSPTD